MSGECNICGETGCVEDNHTDVEVLKHDVEGLYTNVSNLEQRLNVMERRLLTDHAGLGEEKATGTPPETPEQSAERFGNEGLLLDRHSTKRLAAHIAADREAERKRWEKSLVQVHDAHCLACGMVLKTNDIETRNSVMIEHQKVCTGQMVVAKLQAELETIRAQLRDRDAHHAKQMDTIARLQDELAAYRTTQTVGERRLATVETERDKYQRTNIELCKQINREREENSRTTKALIAEREEARRGNAYWHDMANRAEEHYKALAAEDKAAANARV